MPNRVGIIGVGCEGFRPVVSDLSTRELMFEAASKAYADASIEPRKEVGSFICCTEDLWEGWSIADEMVPDQIAGAGRPLCTIAGDAITGLGNAVMHIQAGVAELVTLEAHSKAADVIDKEAVERLAQEPSLIRPVGAGNDSLAALEMDAFMRDGGYDRETLDDLLIRMKVQAMRNPRASFGARLSRTDLEGSELISSPLRRIDKAPYADAGVVLVLASEGWIRRKRREAVWVDGVAWNSSLPWYDGGETTRAGYASGAYARAVSQAGLRKDLGAFDLLELDDTYSYKLLQHLHSLARSRAEEKRVLSGAGPVLNPSGGSLGTGNLLEASAMHRLLESVLQIRGQAGAMQVSGARRALVQSWRGIPTATGGVAVLSG
jgi:acetyl-CoA C-acetyltransferase